MRPIVVSELLEAWMKLQLCKLQYAWPLLDEASSSARVLHLLTIIWCTDLRCFEFNMMFSTIDCFGTVMREDTEFFWHNYGRATRKHVCFFRYWNNGPQTSATVSNKHCSWRHPIAHMTSVEPHFHRVDTSGVISYQQNYFINRKVSSTNFKDTWTIL